TQTVIVGRMEGRTPVPPLEKLRDLAEHQATIVLFLSITLMKRLCDDLLAGGYPPETPVAVVHKASWPDQKIVLGTIADIPERVREARIASQSIIIIGQVLNPGLRHGEGDHRSRLYDADFTHKFRRGGDREPAETSPTPS
ncbi:MAG: SAM-dependent methyltransferase, partial [Chloroflexi bacterium]|nr:SAM-dependent methyltransferase [Chloroflexota bacterium]